MLGLRSEPRRPVGQMFGVRLQGMPQKEKVMYMTYPSEDEANQFTNGDRVALAMALAFTLFLLFNGCVYFERKTDVVKRHAVEEQIQQLAIEKRLQALEQRIYFPLFAAHARNCEQCGSDTPTADGPPALCEEGFKLWQSDLRNNQKK